MSIKASRRSSKTWGIPKNNEEGTEEGTQDGDRAFKVIKQTTKSVVRWGKKAVSRAHIERGISIYARSEMEPRAVDIHPIPEGNYMNKKLSGPKLFGGGRSATFAKDYDIRLRFSLSEHRVLDMGMRFKTEVDVSGTSLKIRLGIFIRGVSLVSVTPTFLGEGLVGSRDGCRS
ncbi:hypothetical protein Tco_0019810 [Tanacetum coccineum]|uniref:Uncharacterized protein n=1 Tax=Tanacetum coccineum TaxID=301880 RepID=A0ABQ5F0R8_9ASTR